MSTTAPCLSQCPDCAATVPAGACANGDIALCIQCGVTFLLPLRSGLTESASAADDLPAEPPATASCRNWRTTGLATATSLVLNGTLLFVLGLLYFHDDIFEAPLQLQGLAPADNVEAFDFVTEIAIDEPPPTETVFDARRVVELSGQNVSLSENTEFALPAGVGGLGGGNGSGSGSGSGMFSGLGDVTSIAYVVDASGSMEGNRMRLVLYELARSINALKDTQKFFVVFFSDKPFPMTFPVIERRLIAATDANRNRILQWAFTVQPDGGTEPQGALQQALELNPDVVFFLTDGDVPGTTIRVVQRYRKPPTIVNTICVGNRAAMNRMKEIALTGGGEFVVVKSAPK